VYNDCQGEFSLSREALKWLAERGVNRAHKILEEVREKPGVRIDAEMIGLSRHCSILVLCVKEMGAEKASGKHSLLRVRTIGSEKYMIRNVGGIETVLTPKEVKWIEIE
jgi:hypothetical protein